MLMVPTSIGCPIECLCIISSTTALNLPSVLLYTTSAKSSLIIGMLVGTSTTSMPYMALNSSSSVAAVPVIPASFLYILK